MSTTGKHISTLALCPRYLREEAPSVYCRGPAPQSVVRITFARRDDARHYKRSHCKRDYTTCPIYRALEENT